MAALIERSFGTRSKLIEWCAAQGLAYCDANPFAYNLIDYLRRKYPHAKFIHLVRDGYACVQSWFRRESTYPDHLPDLRRITWLLAKPVPFASEPAHAAWQTLDRVQRISWFWSSVNANISERFARIPSANKLLLRIEDLREKRCPRCSPSANWHKITCPRRLLRATRRAVQRSNGRLDNVRKFNELAAPMMSSLGYQLR